jgi:hypothetical protein
LATSPVESTLTAALATSSVESTLTAALATSSVESTLTAAPTRLLKKLSLGGFTYPKNENCGEQEYRLLHYFKIGG